MKKKTIFINGYFLNPLTQEEELLNIFLINGILVGFGYLPDEKEDDLEVINLNRALIIPNVLDIPASTPNLISVKNKEALIAAQKNDQSFIGTSPYYFYSDEITANDKNALFEALKNGSISILHSFCDLKAQPKRNDLPLMVTLILNNLHQDQEIERFNLIKKITTNAHNLANKKYPGFALGSKVNFMVFDPKKEKLFKLFNNTIELRGLVTYDVNNGIIKSISYE